ncbi:DNA-formamidopyrimidine glycosylase family protein [Chryseobacterium chendengshani]|uniref:DNA-formamidopyrimidine glycosylase family protein n=1 Tax=Chryseobacterium sp. LJ756 TaxID=2864113 RepID=UPI001C6427A4|nr:DNA-formamidopyrimidine glycosylase family protein [Chryseobacterium sp. LJ756]MBW7674801.1 endonuclease [Chryseobacterium sp. LJ756]
MPEGPTIVLMKEDLQKFVGEKVTEVSGSEVPEISKVNGEILREIKTFGKQTYLIFDTIIFKIHLMMFGSYSLYKRKDIDTLRLGLTFKDDGMYFYTCVVKIVDESLLLKINWEADIMSRKWNPEKTEQTLKAAPKMMICDALMNQDIFSGVGNIIKNEALFRTGIHPESLIGNLPEKKLKEVIAEARNYGFGFKKWKKANVLSKHFQIYHQKKCPICGLEVIKKDTGKSKRTSFFCENDQKLY